MTAPPPPADREPARQTPEPRLWLSALADGERDALAHATALWRDDAGARERWHLYHLIGDVMRSEDLASRPASDAAFLHGLRARLAAEPVPLAPESPTSSPPLARRLGWRAPAAIAAGFVAVAATLVVLVRPQGNAAVGERLAAAGPASHAGGPAAGPAGSGLRVVANPGTLRGVAGPLVADGRMIRDARIDAYLRAHQAARGNSPAALPGGGLRSVDLLVAPVPSGPTVPVARTASEPR